MTILLSHMEVSYCTSGLFVSKPVKQFQQAVVAFTAWTSIVHSLSPDESFGIDNM